MIPPKMMTSFMNSPLVLVPVPTILMSEPLVLVTVLSVPMPVPSFLVPLASVPVQEPCNSYPCQCVSEWVIFSYFRDSHRIYQACKLVFQLACIASRLASKFSLIVVIVVDQIVVPE